MLHAFHILLLLLRMAPSSSFSVVATPSARTTNANSASVAPRHSLPHFQRARPLRTSSSVEPSSTGPNEDNSSLGSPGFGADGRSLVPREGCTPPQRRGVDLANGACGAGTMEALSGGVGDFDPSRKIPVRREVNVGDPQQKLLKDTISVEQIMTELAAIQSQGPKKYCILGTRHCSFLHQQIIELLAYALVLSGNHVYTSGASGTNAAAIRGALRAEEPKRLTVVLPQSLHKQTRESQDLLRDVTDLVTMPQNDDMSLDVASRICNSYLLSQTDQLISFAFHESTTVIEASKEAQKLDMLVTTLYLD